MRGTQRSIEEKNSIALECAGLMLDYDWTLWEISNNTEYPMSSVYKIMMDRLPHINSSAYTQVCEYMERHKRCHKSMRLKEAEE